MSNIATEQEQNIFESIRHLNEEGEEYWLARELMSVLEYDKWGNFEKVIKKAKESLEKSYPHSSEHFAEVEKKIKIGAGSKQEASRSINDYKLTRRACYLIAQNGDSRKKAIALAQNYFATQTRKQELKELQEIKEKDIERILARRKLTESEKKFTGVITERGVDGKGIAEIKSSGDAALFGEPTNEVKKKLGIPGSKALADHLPTISIKAKDLATEMTTFKAKERNLSGKERIKIEHISNNTAVRNMLLESGIYPEQLPAEEDIKKLERKYSEEELLEMENANILSLDVLEIDIRGIVSMEELKNIKNIILNNQGDSTLRIYYGSKSDTKVLDRDIQVNSEVINGLKKYLVMTDNSFN